MMCDCELRERISVGEEAGEVNERFERGTHLEALFGASQFSRMLLPLWIYSPW